jgi:polysaccharide export outer membrane protein
MRIVKRFAAVIIMGAFALVFFGSSLTRTDADPCVRRDSSRTQGNSEEPESRKAGESRIGVNGLRPFQNSGVLGDEDTSFLLALGDLSAGKPAPVNVSEYVVGPGDVIRISVWEHDQFSDTVTIGPDGRITLHLLGDIPVAGLTRDELKDKITERLAEFLTKDAMEVLQVTVSIVEFNSRKIFVFGQVRNPGTVTLTPELSLLEAIMAQAVPTPGADLTSVKIIPAETGVGAARKIMTVNMEEVLERGDISRLPKLRPGDRVYVPPSPRARASDSTPVPADGEVSAREDAVSTASADMGIMAAMMDTSTSDSGQFVIHVMGAVSRQGSYVFTREPMLMEVLLQAGSVADTMLLKYIRIIRGGQSKTLKDEAPSARETSAVVNVDLDKYLTGGDASILPRLYSGDTVYIPPVTQERMKDVSVIVTGEVVRPGSYRTTETLDVLDAISMAGGLTPNADPERIKIRRESADSYQEKIVNIEQFLGDVSESFSTSLPEMVGPGYRIYVPAKRGSAAAVAAVTTRGIVRFLADLVPVYGVYRLVREW